MSIFTKEFITFCKGELLIKKQDLLNLFHETHKEFQMNSLEKGGDEMDQTSRMMAEKDALYRQKRIRDLLLEVENALARIERGNFGVCEITNEPIEPERLKLIPWTRLSIEGAEIKENSRAI